MTKYFNYRRNETECNEELIFCSDNPESSSHYGNIKRTFVADKYTINTENETLRSLFVDFYGEMDEESLNPDNIVSSAGCWDDIDFINHLEENRFFDTGVSGVITSDGAVFFTTDGVLESVEIIEN